MQSALRFNSLLALLTVNALTPGAAHRPLSRALATLVERGVQRGLLLANSEQRCGIVPLSRRSASDWEGEGNDRRSWGEVLRARGAEGLISTAHGEQRCASVPLSRRSDSDW